MLKSHSEWIEVDSFYSARKNAKDVPKCLRTLENYETVI